MLKSVDTFDRIIKMRNKLSVGNLDVFECWKEYISPYPEIKEKCLQDALEYDFDADIKPIILDALTSNFAKLEMAHSNFANLVNRLNDRFHETFSIGDDIFIYFYIGLCNGAGWVTTINLEEIVLIGVEKVVELNWHDERSMVALLYHELSHVAHSKIRHQPSISASSQKEKSIWQLYAEGFAQRYEQILYKDGFYHQDTDGWLDWCKANHNKICKEYLYRISNDLSTQDFFGDWVNFNGYSDVGYYLGCEFIKYIGKDYSTTEIANFRMCELEKLVIDYLERFA